MSRSPCFTVPNYSFSMNRPSDWMSPFAEPFGQHLNGVVRDRGMTILLTTHYLEEADRLCNRVGIIHQGKIVAEGTPTVLKAALRDRFDHEPTLDEVFLIHTGVSISEETEAAG